MKFTKVLIGLMTAGMWATAAGGCASQLPATSMVPSSALLPASQPVLSHSLYSKDATGSLTEEQLQKILAAPIDLQFPARVGIVPLAEPFDARGQVTLAMRTIAARDLAATLIGTPEFSHVSDVSTDLPNTGGIEGLRIIAARYRLRYLLLFSHRIESASHVNGWGWLYPTVVGLFIAPGVTVESRGIVQADLMDVRTGTILFSSVESMTASGRELLFDSSRSHAELRGNAMASATRALGQRVIKQVAALSLAASASSDPPVAPRILRAAIP